jgi:hypothetical protein
MTDGSNATYIATRRQLRGVAESLIAGPQYRETGTIKLAVRADGFTGVSVRLSVHGDQFVSGSHSVPLAGPVSAVADEADVQAGPPSGVYEITDPLAADAVLDIDHASAELLYRSLYAGGFALGRVLPGGHPVLWPEHFDVAVTADEVNYGVSAGDDYHPLPYAYVGPWAPRTGEFWNAPFGAVLSLDATLDLDDLTASVADFFLRGQRELGAAG